jgi:CheY-like chemotaxis protein
MSGHSVLVADDDGLILRMLERTLIGDGFEVTSLVDAGQPQGTSRKPGPSGTPRRASP